MFGTKNCQNWGIIVVWLSFYEKEIGVASGLKMGSCVVLPSKSSRRKAANLMMGSTSAEFQKKMGTIFSDHRVVSNQNHRHTWNEV